MRLVLAGLSGVGKKRVIGQIEKQFPPGTCVTYPAEEDIKPKLSLPNIQDLPAVWWQSFQDHVIQPWNELDLLTPAPQVAIIPLHVSWHVDGQFFSPLLSPYRDKLIKFLRDEFKLEYVVTLIDNIYHSQYAIRAPDSSGRPTGFSFTLAELMRWRGLEVILADILASAACHVHLSNHHRFALYPFERSPMVAIDHSAKMCVQYFSRPQLPRVYLSYPITAPRQALGKGDQTAIDETNFFRGYFSDEFTAFDPVTIDERPLANKLNEYEISLIEDARVFITETLLENRDAPETQQSLLLEWFQRTRQDALIDLTAQDLWPSTKDGGDQLGENRRTKYELSLQQIMAVAAKIDNRQSEIDRQIRFRDFRLIDQSDCVIVYRPTRQHRQDWSGGTVAEVVYATTQARKPVYVIADPAEDGPLAGGPFEPLLQPKDWIEFPVGSAHGNWEARRLEAFREVQRRVNESTHEILKAKWR